MNFNFLKNLSTFHTKVFSGFIPLDRDMIGLIDVYSESDINKIQKALPWAEITAIPEIGKKGSRRANEIDSWKSDLFASEEKKQFDCICWDSREKDPSYFCNKITMAQTCLKKGGAFVVLSSSHGPLSTTKGKDDFVASLRQQGFTNFEIKKSFFKNAHALRCWKRDRRVSSAERCQEIMAWVYNRLIPDTSHKSPDPTQILMDRHALCWGYVCVLKAILNHEGFKTRWISMIAHQCPWGRGPEKSDSHEVLEVFCDAKWILFDPTLNVLIPCSFAEVLKNPEKVKLTAVGPEKYPKANLYATDFWYNQIVRYRIHSDGCIKINLWKTKR